MSRFDTAPMRWGIAKRVALLTSLLVLTATATVGYMVYRGARQALFTASRDGLAHGVDNLSVRLAADLEAVGEDVLFLASTPPVQGIVRARLNNRFDPRMSMWEDEWGTQLAQTFGAFLRSRPSYLQVRFIGGAEARELVRVEHRQGTIFFARADQMETAAGVSYVDRARSRPEGSLFLTDVTQWTAPDTSAVHDVIFAATPVYTEAGVPFGVVVITIDVEQMLEPLRAVTESTRALVIADKEGRILVTANESVAPRLEDSGRRLDDLFPGVAEQARSGPAPSELSEVDLGGRTRGIAYFKRMTFGDEDEAPYFIAGIMEPHATILARVKEVRNQSLFITLLFSFAGIALALSLSNYLTQPLRQITRAVARFGERDFKPALPTDREDEIGVLARCFEALTLQIERQIRELEAEERRQRTILETSAEGIIVTDEEGRIESYNAAAQTIFGFWDEAPLGQTVHRYVRPAGASEADGERGQSLDMQAWTGFVAREAYGRRVDGSPIPLSLTCSAFDLADQRRFTIFVQDITERKEAEAAQEQLLRALEAERSSLKELSATLEERVRTRTADLIRSNRRLEATNRELRDFTFAASHDLQEPLRKLQSFASLLETEFGDALPEEARHYVSRMTHAARRLSELITDLLTFSLVSGRRGRAHPVDLQRIAREAITDLEPQLKEAEADVIVGELPVIEADPAQIRQLLQHLLTNAVKFRREGVRPEVTVRAEIVAEETGAVATDYCVLEVQDNGIGFDEKYLDRIFSPFQRLHTTTEFAGTGIGLTICRRIVEHHGGTITARSEPGVGATFVVKLPLQQKSAEPGVPTEAEHPFAAS